MAEKRKDACVAREHEVALPKELTPDERLDLARQYARDLADRHGCAVDLAIHAPHRDRAGEDNDNYHAHLLCTTRQVASAGLGQKCDREKSGRNRKADLEDERATWADLQNTALEVCGHPQVQVDHRSLKDQGLDREPTAHKGPAVTAMERKGRQSDVLDRLAVAREAGERERAEAKALDGQIINLTGDLHQALAQREQERAEHDRVRAAAFGRIGANLSTADQHHDRLAASLQAAGRAFDQLRRAGPVIAKAGADYQHDRGTGATVEAVGGWLAGTLPEVARATDRLAAIVQAQQQAAQAALIQSIATPPAKTLAQEAADRFRAAHLPATPLSSSAPLTPPAQPVQSDAERRQALLAGIKAKRDADPNANARQAAVAKTLEAVAASRRRQEEIAQSTSSTLTPEQRKQIEEAKLVRAHEQQTGRKLNRPDRAAFLRDHYAAEAQQQAAAEALPEVPVVPQEPSRQEKAAQTISPKKKERDTGRGY